MTILKRMARFLRPYWTTLLAIALVLLVHTGLNLLPPLFQRAIIDDVIAALDWARLLRLSLILVGLHVLGHLTGFADQYLRHALGGRFIFDLRVRIYEHLQRLSLGFFETTSTGELMSRVTNDVNAMENFVTHGVPLTTVDLLRLVGASIVLLALNWQLALVILVPLPFIAMGLRWFNARVRPVYRRVRDR
ncbi:MAG: hypothetical protein JXB35_17510, partial [Anaerolineae bacterium]|nr:hypothetical protein [Anaerolineae bacterium]